MKVLLFKMLLNLFPTIFTDKKKVSSPVNKLVHFIYDPQRRYGLLFRNERYYLYGQFPNHFNEFLLTAPLTNESKYGGKPFNFPVIDDPLRIYNLTAGQLSVSCPELEFDIKKESAKVPITLTNQGEKLEITFPSNCYEYIKFDDGKELSIETDNEGNTIIKTNYLLSDTFNREKLPFYQNCNYMMYVPFFYS